MKVKTIKKHLIKNAGYKIYKKYKTMFNRDFNFPIQISKQNMEIIAHNMALIVLWDLEGMGEHLKK